MVQELGGERIDIVPWHAEPEVFARRALAPARVSKVMSDQQRQVITAIVDEDQLSLAIGRNGQNVRLASQLIGWQIDLYGSREWLELGADLSLFKRESDDDSFETSDFALAELELEPETLSALEGAGYNTFLQIIEFDRAAFLAIEGLGETEADQMLTLIDELTVVADDTPVVAEGAATEVEDTATEVEDIATEVEDTATEVEDIATEVEDTATEVEDTATEDAAAGDGEDLGDGEIQAEADVQGGEDAEHEEADASEDENEAHA